MAGPKRPQRADTFENKHKWMLQKRLWLWFPDAKHDETAARLTNSAGRLVCFCDPILEELKYGKCA